MARLEMFFKRLDRLKTNDCSWKIRDLENQTKLEEREKGLFQGQAPLVWSGSAEPARRFRG